MPLDWENDVIVKSGNHHTRFSSVAIEDARTDVTEAVKSDDAEKIKTAVTKLTEVSMKLGEAVYKSQQKPNEKSKDQKDTKSEDKDNVVDADFEDVKDDKEKSA